MGESVGWRLWLMIGSVAAAIASVVVFGLGDASSVVTVLGLPLALALTVYAPRLEAAARARRRRARQIRNVQARHGSYVGRHTALARLRDGFTRPPTQPGRPVVQVLCGMGGAGKTQLAVEYTWRHADRYPLVWWVRAEQPGLIEQDFAALATALDLPVGGQDDIPTRARAALAALAERPGWLLVFDNVDTPADLHPWIPTGPGHVLVTARSRALASLGTPHEIGEFTPTEAVALLTRRTTLTAAQAIQVADAVGRLPLAVEQAAAYLAVTGATVESYLRLLQANLSEATSHAPGDYPAGVVASLRTSLDRLGADNPTTLRRLQVLACYAPEPLPAGLLTTVTEDSVIPTVNALDRFALARYDPDHTTLHLHRITQAVIRIHTPTSTQPDPATVAADALAYATPDNPDQPEAWDSYRQLTPHLLALLDTPSPSTSTFRAATRRLTEYLGRSGQIHLAHHTATRLHTHHQQLLGPDHPDTLRSADHLANTMHQLGQYEVARGLREDTLHRYRQILGDDHPDTLSSANNLALDLHQLGEYEVARGLREDTLHRYRQILGDDHPDTLVSANNLALDLRALGEYEAARHLNEDTLRRLRQILGDDHPETLRSANNLASDLHALGEYEAARGLREDTLHRYHQILGDDHPETLRSANNLASDLHALGEYEAARHLNEDTLRRLRQILGDNHPNTLRSANNLANTLNQLGDYQAAREWLEFAQGHHT
ncbi:FxSxx-COOH system tetratricopeptide repeat protein [Parafrankia sp. CH37]|nr:FxSxx-COOH system tetratricopeptide repeat protein [Parafrankia sp. CH37]